MNKENKLLTVIYLQRKALEKLMELSAISDSDEMYGELIDELDRNNKELRIAERLEYYNRLYKTQTTLRKRCDLYKEIENLQSYIAEIGGEINE